MEEIKRIFIGDKKGNLEVKPLIEKDADDRKRVAKDFIEQINKRVKKAKKWRENNNG